MSFRAFVVQIVDSPAQALALIEEARKGRRFAYGGGSKDGEWEVELKPTSEELAAFEAEALAGLLLAELGEREELLRRLALATAFADKRAAKLRARRAARAARAKRRGESGA